VGIEQSVTILPSTRAAYLYGVSTSVEDYYCAYGVNPAYRGRLEAAGMVVSGLGDAGEIRIVELSGQFFLATLFLPQTRSPPCAPHPLLAGFAAAVRRAAA
jgi:CTP synthase (UTP-ammonia lyase)